MVPNKFVDEQTLNFISSCLRDEFISTLTLLVCASDVEQRFVLEENLKNGKFILNFFFFIFSFHKSFSQKSFQFFAGLQFFGATPIFCGNSHFLGQLQFLGVNSNFLRKLQFFGATPILGGKLQFFVGTPIFGAPWTISLLSTPSLVCKLKWPDEGRKIYDKESGKG